MAVAPFLSEPAGTLLIYNGYTFPVGTSTKVTVEPVQDVTRRTISYSRIVIDVTWYVANNSDSAQESEMAEIQRRLTKQGASYTLQGHGFGAIESTINLNDVAWGPKPYPIVIVPMGPTAARLSWRMEVAYPQCTNARGAGFPMEYYYETNFSIDLMGYSVRRISGSITFPAERKAGTNRISFTADEFWEKIIPAEIPGFDRTTKDRTISADKASMQFTFVDEEKRGDTPKDIPKAEGNFRIQSFPRNLFKYTGTLSATYYMSKFTPRQAAVDAFVKLMALKMGSAGKDKNGKVTVYPTSFSADEGLYSNADRISFSASWLYTSSLRDCIKDGGMFKPIPDTEYATWRNSQANVAAMSPRGSGGLLLRAQDDIIVDLCSPGEPKRVSPGTSLSAKPVEKAPEVTVLTKVEEDTSWLYYWCMLKTTENSNSVHLKSIPDSPVKTSSDNGSGDNHGGNKNVILPSGRGSLTTNPGDPKEGETVIQNRAEKTYRIILWGYAYRFKFEIVPPKLVSVGGKPAIEVRRKVSRSSAHYFTEPISHCEWEIEYICENPPKDEDIVAPGNPTHRVDNFKK